MMDDFWESEEISARYTRVETLGSGGMGNVYLVKDKVLDKLVAIKVLDASLTAQQSMRFQREGKLSGKLNHENIVSVLDFGISEKNVPYLVMEYLPGKNLGALLQENGPLELETALQIFSEICAAMTHSHSNGILHRDLKPENIIVSESSEPGVHIKIVDFGIARLKEADGQLTQSGSMVGSPLYMAPEQSSGNADERSDIYSFGCLMFATLTGKPPFVGETSVETLMMHKSSEPLTLNKAAQRSFPGELEEIVSKCLRKNSADRFQSFSELNQQFMQLDLSARSKIPAMPESENICMAAAPPSRRNFPEINKIHVWIISCLLAVPIIWAAYGSSDAPKDSIATEFPKASQFETSVTERGHVYVFRATMYNEAITDKDLSLLRSMGHPVILI